MASDQDDKKHPATERQRQRFRDRGEIPRSRDVYLFVTLASVSLVTNAIVPHSQYALSRLMADTVGALDGGLSARMFAAAFDTLAWLVLPASSVGAIAVVVSGAVQARGLPLKEIKLDLARLEPISKLKRMMFSTEALGGILLSVLKIGVIATVCGLSLWSYLPTLTSTPPGHLHGAVTLTKLLFVPLLQRTMGAFAVIALLDYALQSWKLEKRMRMSDREMREEQKEDAGDPFVRQKRRQKARELARSRSLQAVPKATVVVVNPTHYAVALAYDRTKMRAPRVVAKGTDKLAARIRSIARDHQVPVVLQPPLARTLYRTVKVGGEVPEDLYRAVAAVLASLYRAGTRRSL